MKNSKKEIGQLLIPWNLVFVSVFIFCFTFFTRCFLSIGNFPLQLNFSWRPPAIGAISGKSSSISVLQTIVFPDQVLIFLNYPQSNPIFTKDDIDCVYFPLNSSEPVLKRPPIAMDSEYSGHQIIWCESHPPGMITVALKSSRCELPPPLVPSYRWNSLAYDAVIDRDDTTIVFVKGLNLQLGKAGDPTRFKCVFGWDFTNPELLLISEVVSVAQEIGRCKTPPTVLSDLYMNSSMKVSIKAVDKPIIDSVARPIRRIKSNPAIRKEHEICVCTMMRNQARFLREWVMYHAQIGIERWFIYDNNSDDDLSNLIKSLDEENYNITRHLWPWIKTQEAGFAHCALQARDLCEWVGFIDVDEFLHFPSGSSLSDVLRSQSSQVAEVRVWCHNFGPSGLTRSPPKGVIVGYTCRMKIPEKHKSIVKPEALSSTLFNVVHHFHLNSTFESVYIARTVLVINHYKYQVWEVFKDKFYRRVSAFVVDWQDKENHGMNDRTPGLGTQPVEPPDWSTRFCEVNDTGLRDRVVYMFFDPRTQMLPWEEHEEEQKSVVHL